MRFLQLTDTHFGLPANSTGSRTFAALAANVVAGRIATAMATHDEAVVAALRVFVELESPELDAVLCSGDLATTGDERDLALAAAFLSDLIPESVPCFVLPGNHDRFGGPPLYPPGGTAFDTFVVGPRLRPLASPFGFGHQRKGKCILSGLDLTLLTPAGGPLQFLRASGLGKARREILDPFARSLERIATTGKTTHVVVVTHYPLAIGQPMPVNHEVLGGDHVIRLLEQFAAHTSIPTLVISGHLHVEYTHAVRVGVPLWMYTCATTSKRYAKPGRPNACATIELVPGGFSVQRYDFDRTAGVHAFVPGGLPHVFR